MKHLLARIPRETKVSAFVLAVALLLVSVLALVGLGRTERWREDAERDLGLRSERAVRSLVALAVRQIAAQEDVARGELERSPSPPIERAREALARAPLFAAAHVIDVHGEATDARRPPFDAPASVLDVALRRRVRDLLEREPADPAGTADAAVRLAAELESSGSPDLVALALVLQCGARAAHAAGDADRALELARRVLDPRLVALRDDRAVEGEREPFGPAASLLVCETLMRALPTSDESTHAAFVDAVLARRTSAQRMRGLLSETAYRVERDDCVRLRRAATALRAEFQHQLDRGLRDCDAVDEDLDRVRAAPRGVVLSAAVRDESIRVPLPDGSLLFVVPLAGAAPWSCVGFTAPPDALRSAALTGQVGGLDAPEGVALVVRDAAGAVVAGRPPDGNAPTLAESAFGPALPGLAATALLVDPSVVSRESDAARRDWLWILGAAILAVVAASLLAVRAVLREVRLARLKSDFVSNLSHELRTPLTSLRMFVDTLQEGRVRDEAEAKECLAVIAQETDRLSSLVERVLQFAAFAKGRAPIALRSEDAGEVVRRAVQLFRKRAEAAGATLESRVDPGLPEAILDRDAVAQVILNLLDNAVKHAGHDSARIRVTARAEGRGTAILVEDDGPGVPERERELVFEEFYRGDDSLSRRTQGAGLGLALSRRIALAHGGAIDVGRSADLGGAAFRLVLPPADVGRRLAVAAQRSGAEGHA